MLAPGIDLSLAADTAGAEHQLWGAFANRDLFQRYAELDLPGGASVWPVFRERLLAKAEAGGYGRDALEAALRQIEEAEPYLVTEGQLMPIGAFVGRCDEGRAWIIPCCWESGHRPPRDGQVFPVRAGHLRVWAIAMASGRQVGFVTCR